MGIMVKSMKTWWTIWKHALGSYSEDDGFNPANDNAVAIIRTAIVLSNLFCAYFIIWNIVRSWL
jgi:hypothetical protein|tara:strand:- start:455 stop:646 length:192 start_codon:yes stop_codon:yes gene_type:complete